VSHDLEDATGHDRRRTATLAAVALFAAGWFTIGIRLALGWALGWIDSGLVVYGSWRVADGAVPYRDFDHVYGPSLFYLNAALLRGLGADLAVVVWSLLVLKVALVALVFALASRVAGTLVAVATTLLLVVVWGSPLWVFSAPYAQHYGTLCALAGVLVAGRGRGRRALVGAGLLAGVAATFKLTSGLFALCALVLWVLGRTPAGPSGTRGPGWVRAVRIGAACVVPALGILYGAGSLQSGTGLAGVATVLAVVLPFVVVAGAVLIGELRHPGDADGAVDVLVVATAAAAPLVAWGVFFLAQGAGHAMMRDLLTLPTTLRWFEPLSVPAPVSCALVAAVALAVAAPGSRSWMLAVVVMVGLAIADRPTWTTWGGYLLRELPGRIAFDVVGWLPLVSVVAGIGLLRSPAPLARLCLLFAATSLLLLLPAADVWHAFWILPTALPLVACLLAPRPGLAAVLVVFVALTFVVQLEGARRSWRTATAQFVRASGITHPDPKFDDVAALVRRLDEGPDRDRPLLVLTAEAMIYFLAGRRSGFEHEEYLLQTMSRGATSPDSVALLADDADVARRIEAARPLVVDADGNPVRERLRGFLPRTAAVLDAYRPTESFGRYVLLDR
jgi:hypothetical protein